MPGFLERWFGGSGEGAARKAAASWAKQASHKCQNTSDGVMIEPRDGPVRWRMEWGQSQRHYITGPELRVRAELPSQDMRLMVITRPLMAQLEQALFDSSIEGNQTQIDQDLPPEMRWLVMFPKVPRSALGELKERYGCVSQPPRAAGQWLDETLTARLAGTTAWLDDLAAMTLTVQRGRLTLRAAMARPGAPQFNGALNLALAAHASASRLAQALAAGEVDDQPPTAWDAPSAMGSLDATPGR